MRVGNVTMNWCRPDCLTGWLGSKQAQHSHLHSRPFKLHCCFSPSRWPARVYSLTRLSFNKLSDAHCHVPAKRICTFYPTYFRETCSGSVDLYVCRIPEPKAFPWERYCCCDGQGSIQVFCDTLYWTKYIVGSFCPTSIGPAAQPGEMIPKNILVPSALFLGANTISIYSLNFAMSQLESSVIFWRGSGFTVLELRHCMSRPLSGGSLAHSDFGTTWGSRNQRN